MDKLDSSVAASEIFDLGKGASLAQEYLPVGEQISLTIYEL